MANKLKTFFHKFHWYKILTNKFHRATIQLNPKFEANRTYSSFFKKDINWDNPRDLIEKIYWLQFNSDTTLWTKCADKYLVRQYIKEKGLKNYLPKLYGHWDNADNIDFDSLPESFVLKTNNGCGTVIVVKDKSELNIPDTRKKLNKWLKLEFGYRGAQLHYLKIEPGIIAEELLINNKEDVEISPNSLVDYKLYCVAGEPEVIWVAYDRTKSGVYHTIYDKSWIKHPEYLVSSDYYNYHNRDIKKPVCLNEMIEISRIIAKDFPQIRVDFYVINGSPVIGELTLTTGFGFFTPEFYNYLGEKIDIQKVNY